MSEVAEDLQATDATPVTPSDTAGAVPVAGDLFDSDSADTAAFVGEETSEASAFDPDTTDWLRVNPDEVPEQYRPLSGIARNMQAQFTRTQQDAKDRERQVALCGGNIFLLLGTKAAIRSQTKRIDALRESLQKKNEGLSNKKVRQ